MRSLQDYRNIYSEIAGNLNLQGASVELLIQFLAQASYIGEVENVSYVEEASLEKASLLNSKIEHCMNEMYSVYRGSCPRVMLNIVPSKYFTFSPFDEIVTSNSFKIYYLGYLSTTGETTKKTGTDAVALEEGFVYGPISIPPSLNGESYTIIGLLASETVEKDWTLNENNTYYVQTEEENLSNDMWVKVNGEYKDVTRKFSDHIEKNMVFDLTIPSYGSRLYVADILRNSDGTLIETMPNTEISALYYKLSSVSDYNGSELKKINLKGAELVAFDDDFLNSRNVVELSDGLILLNAIEPDTITTIHYKANKDRYVNSILRSNSDIGIDLQEMYPNKVVEDGTSYNFSRDDNDNCLLTIYYIPKDLSNILKEDEIQTYIDSRSAYYVTDNIEVNKGDCVKAFFHINLLLYKKDKLDDVKNTIELLLKDYSNKFNVNLNNYLVKQEIEGLILKDSNIKSIKEFSISFTNESTDLAIEDIDKVFSKENLRHTYFTIDSQIQGDDV